MRNPLHDHAYHAIHAECCRNRHVTAFCRGVALLSRTGTSCSPSLCKPGLCDTANSRSCRQSARKPRRSVSRPRVAPCSAARDDNQRSHPEGSSSAIGAVMGADSKRVYPKRRRPDIVSKWKQHEQQQATIDRDTSRQVRPQEGSLSYSELQPVNTASLLVKGKGDRIFVDPKRLQDEARKYRLPAPAEAAAQQLKVSRQRACFRQSGLQGCLDTGNPHASSRSTSLSTKKQRAAVEKICTLAMTLLCRAVLQSKA